MSDEGPLVTNDIQLAAFLRAHDIRIVDVRKDEWNKISIHFANTDGVASRLKLDFYNHDDNISASKLLWSHAQIKQILFDQNLHRPAPAKVAP